MLTPRHAFIAVLFIGLLACGAAQADPTLAMTIKPEAPLKAGVATPMTLVLTHLPSGRPVHWRELRVVHTQRLHLLVVDPTLTDYQHIHPIPGHPGHWSFTFTPKKEGSYRIWADVTPAATGKQEYVKADVGTPIAPAPPMDKTTNHTTTVEGYTFDLAFDGPLRSGEAVMGKVRVADRDGHPVTMLEPVMGAFAHIVGFSEDGESVVHVHPMGPEPQHDSARGGPELQFHFEPEKSGFTKLFVQVKLDNKDVFAPFGVEVR